MTSLQEVYVSVKGLIATNLSTMGVTGYSSDDGLTTLANAILEVEGGSDLTITLDLQSSSSSIYSGQTVNLTATLTATFDGETVDLNSVLQNAPITFKEGNTTINTVSTNSNGVATISNYAPVGTGTVTLSAQFPTTDGFNGATDVITITVEDVTPVATTLTLTADKSILSYADSESATLSATVLDQFDAPMSGETVEFFNGSTSMGTATTNASGVATKSYSSTGAGDLSFTAEVGSLVSEIFVITDIFLYDTLTSDKNRFTTTGSLSATYSSNGLSVVGTASSDAFYILDQTLPSNYEVELEISSQTIGMYNSASELVCGGIAISNQINNNVKQIAYYRLGQSGVTRANGELINGDVLKFKVETSTVTIYLNGNQYGTISRNTSNYPKFQIKTYKDRGVSFKNLKIKPL